jgi:hypothetical protein
MQLLKKTGMTFHHLSGPYSTCLEIEKVQHNLGPKNISE